MTSYLLDTHVWIWWTTQPERIGDAARDLLADPATVVMLSAASTWEIAIKHALGRIELPSPPARFIPDQLALQGIRAIAIEHAHAAAVATLPAHHADPFDRLLVAQAQALDATLVSADEQLLAYAVELLDPR